MGFLGLSRGRGKRVNFVLLIKKKSERGRKYFQPV